MKTTAFVIERMHCDRPSLSPPSSGRVSRPRGGGMIEGGPIGLVLVPAGLGLIGFVEPCSIGSSLIFVKYLEGKGPAAKLAETLIFTLTRALFIGALGAVAAAVGSAFLDLQRGAWILLGALHRARPDAGDGARADPDDRHRPALRRLGDPGGAAGASAVAGFVALGIFGLALALPLVAVVLVPQAARLLDRFAGLSGRYCVAFSRCPSGRKRIQ